MMILAVISLVAATLLFVTAMMNLLVLSRMRGTDRPQATPRVSVLVPARNEERSIDACVRSLAAQQYPDLEVIVLDDNSTDRTHEIVTAIAASDPRVSIIRGADLPAGWVGKCYACHQLSQRATGEILLFTDADTVHAPQALRAAVAQLERQRADLFTMIPFERLDTWWEQLLLPFLHFTFIAYLPIPLITRARGASLAMANGQYMMFRRAAYHAIGGHTVVRNKIVEDIELGRAVKRAGLRIAVADGTDMVTCRMYTSFDEIWSGFSKNLYSGFGSPVPFLFGMGSIAIASIVPFIGAIAYALYPAHVPVAFVPAAAAVLAIRVAAALRFKLSVFHALLHPLASAFVIAIGMNSWRLVRGSGPEWKGRKYPGIHRAA